MDPGHFLTDSGSKIPTLRSRPPERVPRKPVLAATETKVVNVKPTETSQVKASSTKSNLTKATGLTRSKTNLGKPAVATSSTTASAVKQPRPQAGVKRHASSDDVGESTAPKVAKVFPYKGKPWELKLRLAECEEWLTESRARVLQLEMDISSNAAELADLKDTKENLHNERERARDLGEKLQLKTDALNKLEKDSKHFLDKIQMLENDIGRKQSEQVALQADLSRLREESLATSAEMSKLRFSLDDVEFKFKRQKNSLDDLESSYNQCKNENSQLEKRIKERDQVIAEVQDKLEQSERDNRHKENKIRDLDEDLQRERNKTSDLEKSLSSSKRSNDDLSRELTSTKEEVTNLQDQLAELTKLRQQTLDEFADLRNKFCDSEKLRRYLHNQVQDLKGNIRVFCRVRPPLPSEKENCMMCSINIPDEGTIEVSKSDPFENSNTQVTSRPKFQKHEFSFDRVFHPNATQSIVFEELSQLVQSALDGYNVSIFAYGQTGSGKTYTMEGPNAPETRGMIPRTVLHIFQKVSELESIGWEYKVEVCFIEIYNEVIRDLLRTDKDGTNLKIMQVDPKTNDVAIPGLTVMEVKSYEDLDRLYILAHQNRATASTCYNERSSRSHSVTKIKVTGMHKERGETCYGSLSLVDLAGSERLNEQTSSSDPRLREMKNINKSLSELGNVILGLYQKNEHIPYRNSKLTHLLQPALGGSSKTLMLVNISPVESCMSETLCSLRFAQKVNQVKVGTSKKRITYEAVVPK